MAKRKSGEGSWGKKNIKGVEYNYYKKTYDGKMKYFYGHNQKEIREKIKEFEKIRTLNSSKEIRKMSFYDYVHKWLHDIKIHEIAHKTFDNYEYFTDNRLKGSSLGDIQIGMMIRLERRELDRLIKEFFDDIAEKFSKSLIDTGYTVINQVFTYGVHQEIFLDNPMVRFVKPKSTTKQREIVALTMDEVERLWTEMHRINTVDSIVSGKEGTPVYGMPAYLAMFICYTGLRIGEATGLHREYINKEEKYATINSQMVYAKNRSEDENAPKNIWIETLPKGNKTRIIPLADRALEIIEMVEKRFPDVKQNKLQFSRSDIPMSESNVNRVLKQMCKRAKIEKDVTPHVLRHTFASILLNDDDKSLPVISEILGHSSVEITYQVYIDIFMKKKMQAISLFNKVTEKQDSAVETCDDK